MPGAAVVTRGGQELVLQFQDFPEKARARLESRIHGLIDQLEGAVREAAPVRTGKLRSEITERIYSDQPSRIAGYVQVYAPGVAEAYPKAATLEYGTDKPRRIPDHGGIFRRLGEGQKRIESRLTAAAHIEAFRYLRGPFEEMEGDFQTELQQALDELVAEGNG
jgi:hypothetical protein